VKVTFAPIAPGARNGAVEIVDGSGNVLAATYISGIGVGPLVSFGPPVPRAFNAGNFNSIGGVAVDASGNVFIADATYSFTAPFGDIRELMAVNGVVPSNPVVKYLPIGNGHAPVSIAIDGEGNLFFADYVGYADSGTNNIVELLAADGYSASRIILTGLGARPTVAVDGSGNVFAADQVGPTTAVPSIKEIFLAGNYTTTKILGGGFYFHDISGIAVDSSGNLFATEYSQSNPDLSAIEEILATGGYTTVRTISNALLTNGYAVSVAVDPAGNLFASIFGPTNELFLGEFLAVNGVVPANPGYLTFTNVSGIAFDQRGNLYGGATDAMNNLVLQELQFASVPSLAFESVSVGNTSSDSPKSISIQNQGNADLDVSDLAVSTNWDQVPGSGTPADCTANFSLVAGAVCNLSISFKPTEVGALTGEVTLKENSLNVPGATASGSLSGTGTEGPPPPHITAISTSYPAALSSVTLTGSNFGATSGTNLLDYENKETVSFNGKSLPILSQSRTALKVAVPTGAVTGVFHVLVNDTVMNTPTFTVTR
jgi:hypothetical protein